MDVARFVAVLLEIRSPSSRERRFPKPWSLRLPSQPFRELRASSVLPRRLICSRLEMRTVRRTFEAYSLQHS